MFILTKKKCHSNQTTSSNKQARIDKKEKGIYNKDKPTSENLQLNAYT